MLKGLSFPLSLECYTIGKVVKTKVSHPPKNIFFIKVETHPHLPKIPHLNTPSHIYVTVLEDLHNSPKAYAKKGGVTFILAVVLLPPSPCRGDAVCL